MGNIRVLTEEVANKIAAGEVVERPASVVKELVENSLDAGASEVRVCVKHGGKSLIRVKDNGSGMDREDAAHCLLRHATSKIQGFSDIDAITTLGFRGEALPSIASVSRLVLTTRQKTDETATVVKTAAGKIEKTEHGAAEPGTTIEVSDLFFNTPARKKFLKSEPAEFNAIVDQFNSLALGAKEVSFNLLKNDSLFAAYPACKELRERIRQVYSSDFTDSLYDIHVDKPDVKLTGFIGTPENTRPNRTGQRFFINTRQVIFPYLSNAIGRAYKEFIPHGRFPVAILFLEIQPGYLDVNVHPAKREIRLTSERYIIDSIASAIHRCLVNKGFFSGSTTTHRSEENTPDSLSFEAFRTAGEEMKKYTPAPAFDRGDTGGAPGKPTGGNTWVQQRIAPQEEGFGIRRIIGQVLGAYVVAEADDGIYFFDQHAAHERIIYEDLLNSPEHGKGVSRKTAFPIVLHLNFQENELMNENLKDFCRLGIDINPLGGNSYSIDAVPMHISESEASTIIKDTLQELLEETRQGTRQTRKEQIAALLACKTYSFKAGRNLSEPEMSELITTLATRANPHTCPHGRPAYFVVSKEEIEKRLKRRQ